MARKKAMARGVSTGLAVTTRVSTIAYDGASATDISKRPKTVLVTLLIGSLALCARDENPAGGPRTVRSRRPSSFLVLHRLDDLLRRVGKVAGGEDGQAAVGEDLLAELDIGAFQAHHQRHGERDFLRGGDDALRDDVAFHDAAEGVDQDALHIGIADDDLERLGHLLLGGAAADVEEVGRRAAIELDDVHRL